MTPTARKVRDSLDLGIEYLSRMSRTIRRPDGVLRLPPETDLAVSHDSPGMPLTRVVPFNSGQVVGGPERVSITGVDLPVLKMKGHPSLDFSYFVIGVPDHGGVTNIVSSGPTRADDTWTFEQTADYRFDILGVEDSVWSVKYKSTWSATSSFPPNYQISIRKESGRQYGGFLVWDNFAIVPENTQDYVLVVDQEGEQPLYRSPTAFHTTRYHKNLWMASRHLALYSGNQLMQSRLPGLNRFWRQFSAIRGQEAPELEKRIIEYDLYDGLFGWGGDRDSLFVESHRTPEVAQRLDWLTLGKTFYDPKLYSRLFPLDLARAPYQSHAASLTGNLLYLELVWLLSPQLKCHRALQKLWANADSEGAWELLNSVAWDGHGIQSTADPNDLIAIGTTVDAYKGNWLALWLCAVTVLEAYLSRVGDPNGHLAEVEQWADEAATSVLLAQVPGDGVFVDSVHGSLCQPDHAGGVFNGYLTLTDFRHKSMGWHSS